MSCLPPADCLAGAPEGWKGLPSTGAGLFGVLRRRLGGSLNPLVADPLD